MKTRESGGKKPNSEILKLFPSQGTRLIIPYKKKKNPDDCQIFFAILLHILFKNSEKKKEKSEVLALLSLTSCTSDLLLPLTCGTVCSQVKVWKTLNMISAVNPVSQTETVSDI